MSSKSVGTPLSSIFQQWTLQQLQLQSQPTDHHHRQQQQQQQEPCHQDEDHGYNILYQTSSFTSSIIKRVRAAEPVENEHVYRHANVMTPAEIATRQSLAGPAWLLRLIELAVTWSRSGGSGNTTASSSTPSTISNATDQQGVAVLWIQTQNVHVSPIDCLVDEDQKRRIRIIDLCCHKNSFGWDDEDGSCSDDDGDGDGDQEEGHNTNYSMTDLSKLFRKLRDELSSIDRPVIIIWQSLMPLFILHGFNKVVYFLSCLTKTGSPEKVIPACLQVWQVDKEGLTSHQHSQLESLAHAIMFLKGGSEMTIMRRGVRERDNLLRDVVPYELVRQNLLASSTVSSGRMYYRVEELYHKSSKTSNDKPSKSVSSTTTDMESITLDDNCTKMKISDDNRSMPPGGAVSSTRRSTGKVELRLEDDDEETTKKNRAPAHARPTHDGQKQKQTRPRIYLEDDDPEFADIDEDDPDDDLDF